jgi:hypothetical protein
VRYIVFGTEDRSGSLYLFPVGQTAPLLAHASYAAAGPVNRADGDANNDQIHNAQQRLWTSSFLLPE